MSLRSPPVNVCDLSRIKNRRKKTFTALPEWAARYQLGAVTPKAPQITPRSHLPKPSTLPTHTSKLSHEPDSFLTETSSVGSDKVSGSSFAFLDLSKHQRTKTKNPLRRCLQGRDKAMLMDVSSGMELCHTPTGRCCRSVQVSAAWPASLASLGRPVAHLRAKENRQFPFGFIQFEECK